MKKRIPQSRRILLAIIFSLIFNTTNHAKDWKGVASWYGGGEKLNKYTASGEEFDNKLLAAAMWDIPFGTKFKVTNLANGKSVIVYINDRGPARRLNRLIDLTKSAFSEIADLKLGIIEVKIEEIKK